MKNKYIDIRKELHRIAELSANEYSTSEYIFKQLQNFKPDRIINKIGSTGIIAIFDTGKPGKTTMFRCELDALPIAETNTFEHVSINNAVSHKCGHDGHMAILLALADWISQNKFELRGKICLLFQPAEETAFGAKQVLDDKRFIDLKPDYIFALHNLPGFPKNSLVLRKGAFAAASAGMKFRFTGKASHAGHPENGNSPLNAMQIFISELQNISQAQKCLNKYSFITIIHVKLGDEAFGTSPGKGVVMATLRAHSDEILQKLASEAKTKAEAIADSHNLKLDIETVEEFAATVNHNGACDILQKAAIDSKLDIIYHKQLFPWTEDFSFYSQKYKTAFLGLGSGEDHPQLHNPDYDFPDELIESGCNIFSKIINEINKY